MHDFRISDFTNAVNGRIDNKTWCKCEYCAPMETSIGVCCLEIPEICKPRFSSASGLNVCRSDPYFVIWFSRKKTSLVLWFQPSVDPWQIRIKVSLHFTLLLKQIFFFIRNVFCESIFSRASDWIHGVRNYWKHILSSKSPEVAIHRCSRTS